MTSVLVSSRSASPGRTSSARGMFSSAAMAAALLLPAAGLLAQTPGSQDTTFNVGISTATVYAVDYQTDVTPKITVGGDRFFGGYLTTDAFDNITGTIRTDFVFPDFGNVARIIYTIVPERMNASNNGLPNLLLGGFFGRGLQQVKDGIASQNIIRIAPDGSLDTGFEAAVGTGANNYVTAILPQDDGRIIVGGQFTQFNRQPRRRLARLLNSGGLDSNYAAGLNIDNDVLTLADSLDPVTGLADGSTLVGGIFNHVAGQPYGKLVRLDPNGNLDMSFHPNIDLRVLAILVQPNGKIVIGGDFTNVNGTAVSRLARLNYDGSLDTTFTGGVSGVPNKDVNPTAVYVLRAISDGRIYVGGEFAQVNGAPRQYLGLISADGVLDSSFAPTPANVIYDSVQAITVQPDNNVIIGETLGPKIGKAYQPSLIRLYGVPPGSNDTVGITTQSARQEAVTTTTAESQTRSPLRVR